MPQINKGTTFVDNQVVTAALLNTLIDGAQLGSQSITQQTQITNGIVATDDVVAVYNLSTTNLRKANVGQVIGSNIPVVTSIITGQATQTSTTAGAYLATADIVLNPQDSASISGTYLSSDGITVTVTTATANQIIAGQYVQLASAGTYSGTYRVATVQNTTTFTIVVPPIYGTGTFLSANGTTVTVTGNGNHFLTSGQSVKIDASIPSYSGTFTITVTSATVFTYTLPILAIVTGTTSYVLSYKRSSLVPATTTSCTFIKKGTEVVNGNEVVTANKYTIGDSFNNGITTFNNSVIANGDTTFAGNTVLNGNNQFNGTANIIGQLQKQGTNITLPLYSFTQFRTQNYIAVSWGGAQNPTNLYGSVIPQFSFTYTAKKAGNALIIDFYVSGETNTDVVFLVTRNPQSGTGAGIAVPLPYNVDFNNNTWSGCASWTYDNNNDSTPASLMFRMIDENTLAVPCTYELRVRSSGNSNTYFCLNRTFSKDLTVADGLWHEQCMSSRTVTELLT